MYGAPARSGYGGSSASGYGSNRRPEGDGGGLYNAMLSYGGGALYSLGNLLDIPNSMFRDIATGQNPFDQLLSPLSHRDRATGREVLNFYGLASREKHNSSILPFDDPAEWLQDVAGMGLEMLSPAGYLGMGRGAAKAAGRKASSALDLSQVNLPGVARRSMLDRGVGGADIATRRIGPREARMNVRLKDLKKDPGGLMEINKLKKRNPHLHDELFVKNTDEFLSEGLSWNLMGKRLPMRRMGSYATRTADIVGERMSRSLPVRGFNAMFKDRMGSTKYHAQKINKGADDILTQSMADAVERKLELEAGRDGMYDLYREVLGPDVDNWASGMTKEGPNNLHFELGEMVEGPNVGFPGVVTGRKGEDVMINFYDADADRVIPRVYKETDLRRVDGQLDEATRARVQDKSLSRKLQDNMMFVREMQRNGFSFDDAFDRSMEVMYDSPIATGSELMSQVDDIAKASMVQSHGALGEDLHRVGGVLARSFGYSGIDDTNRLMGDLTSIATKHQGDVAGTQLEWAKHLAERADNLPTKMKEELLADYGMTEIDNNFKANFALNLHDLMTHDPLEFNSLLKESQARIMNHLAGQGVQVSKPLGRSPEVTRRLFGAYAGGNYQGVDAPLWAGWRPRVDGEIGQQMDQYRNGMGEFREKMREVDARTDEAYRKSVEADHEIGLVQNTLRASKGGYWHRPSSSPSIKSEQMAKEYSTTGRYNISRQPSLAHFPEALVQKASDSPEVRGTPAALLYDKQFSDALDRTYKEPDWEARLPGKKAPPKEWSHPDIEGGKVFTEGKEAHAIALHEQLNDMTPGIFSENDPIENFAMYQQEKAFKRAQAKAFQQSLSDPANHYTEEAAKRMAGAVDELVVEAIDPNKFPAFKGMLIDNPSAQYVQFKKNGKIVYEMPIASESLLRDMLGPRNIQALQHQSGRVRRLSGALFNMDKFEGAGTQRVAAGFQGIPLDSVYAASGMDAKKAREYLTKISATSTDGVFVDPALASDWHRMGMVAPEKDGWAKMLTGFASKLNNIYKTNVTLWFPAFYARNAQGGHIANLMTIGAHNAAQYAPHVAKIRRIAVKGAKTPEEQRLLDLMLKYEIATDNVMDVKPAHSVMKRDTPHSIRKSVGPTNVRETFGRQLAEVQQKRKQGGKLRGALHKAEAAYKTASGVAGDVNSAVEWTNRGALFSYLIDQGYDAAQAAKRVKLTHVDYGRTTPFERDVMGNAFTFYKFSRGMFDWMTDEIVQTGASGPMAKGIAMAGKHKREDDPTYLADSVSLGLGGGAELAGLGVPFEDVVPLTPLPRAESLRRSLADLGTRLNPLLRAPVEWATNWDLYQDRPKDKVVPTLGRILNNVTGADPRSVPSWVENLAMLSPAARAVSTVSQATNPKKSGWAFGGQFLTGMAVREKLDKSRAIERREVLDRYLKDLGAKSYEKVYMSKDDKAALTPEDRMEVDLIEELRRGLSAGVRSQKASATSPVR